MPPLLTPHALLTLTGDPHTLISLTNLQTTLPLGTDAWGRASIPQPLLISSTISLLHPFTTASSTDTVTPSTVHYGTLSKAILGATKEFEVLCKDEERPVAMNLRGLVGFVLWYLTGWDGLERGEGREKGADGLGRDYGQGGGAVHEPLLKNVAMRLFELEIHLPKASLMGNGVSLKGSFGYHHEEEVGREIKGGPSAYSMVLRLKELRVPTLVGVNPNERLAKQMVRVGVEMQRWDWMVDGYSALEEVVVKSTEESSFQTLEALAQHLIERIIQYVLIPRSTTSPSSPPLHTQPNVPPPTTHASRSPSPNPQLSCSLTHRRWK
ncbi:hypothetical protein BKA65DRAFT_134957 [Rhexocercosporidium sp. MPI-PUGE-AT-0058]|nr:hypothetical protein BKA65DRAFT_134957 [Rhexocercosporidium sp. MPI-PUGE-AT-0058]